MSLFIYKQNIYENYMTTKIENLTDDEPLLRQSWVLISFLSPEGIKNCTLRGLKIRGVFESRPEAEDHAKKLRDSDPNFDIHIGEVGKWLPWDPDPSSYKEVNHPNEKLNELMQARNEQLEKAKLLQQQIKNDKLKDANQDATPEEFESRKEKIQNRLKKKLSEKQAVAKDNVNPEPESKQESKEESKEEVKSESKEEPKPSGESVQEKLERVKKLYAKYKNN
jgi:hypothetical protein